MLIDPGNVYLPVSTGTKWRQAMSGVISAGLGAGIGISSADEALEALTITAFVRPDGALHMRVSAPWGKYAELDAPPQEWMLVPGGLPQ